MQWAEGIDSTLMNVVRLSRLAIPAMRRKKWGRIIHLTSLAGKQPIDLLTISSTLRAGLSALTKTMSNQLAADGILVNAVLPGHVWTDRQVHLAEIRAREEGTTLEAYRSRIEKTIPLRRFARAEEVGEVVAFLASERPDRCLPAGRRRDHPGHVLNSPTMPGVQRSRLRAAMIAPATATATAPAM